MAFVGPLVTSVILSVFMLSSARKVCLGPDDATEEFIHIDNIDLYHGCTVIKGSIRILQPTFDGDPFYNRFGMHPDKLYAFRDVEKITGYLMIQGTHPHFTHLNYFSNLTTVQGKQLKRMGKNAAAALSVTYTSLRTINFNSLRKVLAGDVIVLYNPDLCYVIGENFQSRVLSIKQNIIVLTDTDMCAFEGRVCSRRCSSGLCWSASSCVDKSIESNSLRDLMAMMSYN